LDASCSEITDEGIKYLTNLTQLQASRTKITSEGIKHLKKFKLQLSYIPDAEAVE
jgi:hypothetical protein